MKVISKPDRNEWVNLLKRPEMEKSSLESDVAAIMQAVRTEGDAALRRYTEKFDGVKMDSFLVTEAEFQKAENMIELPLKIAIHQARTNIERFHQAQREETRIIETTPGVRCWSRAVGIEKVGLYIPGGNAPLFSTILMLGIPATIAGCKEIVVCTPADENGEVNHVILYVASTLGIKKVFKVGGAQAIAAMAYGTESIPRVYKLFGPGNQYVTSAKKMVNREGVAIDMPAGPSELAIWADETCNPSFVAADLLSQAEHGSDSQVVLVSTNEKLIKKILTEINRQLEFIPRADFAKSALENSIAFCMASNEDCIDLLNEYAPEHLIIACEDSDYWSTKVVNAGSVFLGNYSCESAGDYASGTNHTLPTNGFAKAYSGVSLDSFVKKITFQRISADGILNLGFVIETMAEAEGLWAHKNAVTLRLNKIKNDN